jgi:hypothetical protein
VFLKGTEPSLSSASLSPRSGAHSSLVVTPPSGVAHEGVCYSGSLSVSPVVKAVSAGTATAPAAPSSTSVESPILPGG